MSRGSVNCIVTRVRAGQANNRGSIPGKRVVCVLSISEYEATMLPRNVGIRLPIEAASYPVQFLDGTHKSG
jgi:hypothetical protein